MMRLLMYEYVRNKAPPYKRKIRTDFAQGYATEWRMKKPLPERLKELREAAGLTVREVAQRIGVPHTTYSYYESPKYKKGYMPPSALDELVNAFTATGRVTEDEVRSQLKLHEPARRRKDEAVRPRTTALDANLVSRIFEVDVRAGLGSGGVADETVEDGGNGYTISGDAIRDEWALPAAYVAGELRADADNLRIIEVRGDSMAPSLLSGDRVMIDQADTNPTPPGIFALWDGFGVVVKRLERVPQSDPPAVTVISDNTFHSPYQLTADEARILGRVIWFARRM
jgi:transcriptional regulator with XRE-family HTH domain